jgi:hypothetical protein
MLRRKRSTRGQVWVNRDRSFNAREQAKTGFAPKQRSIHQLRHGRPSRLACSHARKVNDKDLCVWCFDLFSMNGRDLRALHLIERKTLRLLATEEVQKHAFAILDSIDEAGELLAACDHIGPRRHRNGEKGCTVPIPLQKCRAWSEANKHHQELFKKRE